MNAVACRHSPTAKAMAAASRQAKPPWTASRHATTQTPAASDSAPTRLRPSAALTIGSCASTTVAALARISRPITLGAIPSSRAYGGTIHASTPQPTAIRATLISAKRRSARSRSTCR